ncbi:FAD:protein FMN transferase [Spirosoma sordidisoli]|nr:FAD:protein FMN transferase [Spirosoma sordidisoli]
MLKIMVFPVRLFGLLVLCLANVALAQPVRSERFTFRRGLMGTQFTLTVYAPDSLTAQRANAAVSARMDTLNQVMSDYLDGSEINRLSGTSGSNQWVTVSADLFRVLWKARQIARLSGGRYDPTIGPLSQLWRRAVRQRALPNRAERRRARRAVGYRYLELDSGRRAVRLTRSGMRLDVGGIGQGFAIDEAAGLLRRLGLPAFLLDLGGDVLAGEGPWRVGFDSTTIRLHRAAITTSGDLYRHFDYHGRRYSHIMNPRSGLGLRQSVRATVLASDGWRADALTKVFSVAGLRRSRRLLKRFPDAELYRIDVKNGRQRHWRSAGFPVR